MVNAYLLQFHMGNLANYCLDFALTLPYVSHLTFISTKTSKFIIYQFSFGRKINYCILFRAFPANNIIICIPSCFLFGPYLFYHLKRYQFFLLPHGLIGHCRFAESWRQVDKHGCLLTKMFMVSIFFLKHTEDTREILILLAKCWKTWEASYDLPQSEVDSEKDFKSIKVRSGSSNNDN